jgi:hypothetical protein
MTIPEDRILELAEELRKLRSEGLDKSLSEQDTKAVLVEPLLEIAGWAVRDPTQVSREDRPTERPVDYALKIAGQSVVLVECKRLSNPLTNRRHLEQALAYASSAGVRWCVLTNGCLFRVYNSLAPEVAEKKLLEHLDLAKVGQEGGVPVDRALRVVRLISPHSVESGEIDAAWEQQYTGTKIRETVIDLLSGPDSELVNLVRRRMLERGDRLSKKETARWLGTLDIKVRSTSTTVPSRNKRPKPPPGKARPTRISVGTYGDDVKYSYEILTKTAEWLIRQGKLKASDCPVPTGRKRNLVNTEARHRDGEEFTAPRELSNGLWIETNHSTAGCIGLARRLLKMFGYPEEMLEVK